MTGRNHHASGMARIVETSSGFPGYDANIPPENGFLSEILVRNGYATYTLGKWHLAPAHENNLGGTRTHWPLSKGFERYHLTEDLTNKAIGYIKDLGAFSPDKWRRAYCRREPIYLNDRRGFRRGAL